MLTIFSIPKPFEGHVGVIQGNAARSWLCLKPKCEIILFGDEPGVEEFSRSHGIKNIRDVPKTPLGTPLLNSAFEQAQAIASNQFVCYVNADIILTPDITHAVSRLPFSKFLMVGRRWNMDIMSALDFEDPDWLEKLEQQREQKGILHTPAGIDYFVFPRGSLERMPDFAVGRPRWDNWLIFRACQLDIPVIDATESVTVIHQNHGYNHVPGYRGDKWEGPEGDANMSLTGGVQNLYILTDATWRLTRNRLIRNITPRHLMRLVYLWIRRRPHLYALFRGFKHAILKSYLLIAQKFTADRS